ncbi:Histidine kinase [Mesorhizobium ventifaucium]|uniref:histidine kinase n=2 Tax=Mesorhizobium ventifaucium TaxID=666020 RepID=A0ABN8JYB2_9HYPH|nr:Histidine kinase [Mesorhizobium ventifaucium]
MVRTMLALSCLALPSHARSLLPLVIAFFASRTCNPPGIFRLTVRAIRCLGRLASAVSKTALIRSYNGRSTRNVLSAATILAFKASLTIATASADPAVHRILILHQDSSTMTSAIEIADGLAKGLGKLATTKLEIYTEFLDSGRFSTPDHLRRLADGLHAKFESIPLHVVVAVGPEALRFILDHRSPIAPTAAIIFGDLSERSLKRLSPRPDMKGVVSGYDIAKTTDLAIGLQPDARRIVVVSGSAEFDRSWQDNARHILGDRYHDLPVEYLSGLTLESMMAETEKLTAQTILPILTIFEDASGTKYRPRDAAAKIAAVSGAPSYGLLSSYVGLGIVGGNMGTYRSIGEDIAAKVIERISGDESAPQIVYATNFPVLDWRQLERWGLDKASLPDDANILHYTPTLWETYRWQITLVGLALLAQSLAILGLFYERRRRHAAEIQSRHRLLEVVHLNQSATAGALSASIAHELNQPLGAIRSNAEAAEILLQSDQPDLKLIQQIIADIKDDDQRAGDIIQRLRKMLKKRGEIDWQDFDLNEVLDSSINILHAEAERQKVSVRSVRGARHLPVRADRVHIQQVIINLAMNAMDAMDEKASPERRLEFQTAITNNSTVELSISDTGVGIPNERLAAVFDPFYTTKPAGTGLGLSIARTIIETYGGRIWAANRPEGGTVFRFDLPLAQSIQ